jgi:cysteine-rich repeat protein
MGTRLILPSKKFAMMAQVDAQVASATQALAGHVLNACATFVAIYGEDPLTVLKKLRSRADCVVNGAYVQSEVTCPAPVCGNGIKETGEQCDDGNQIDTDACRNNCTLGP